MSRIDDVGVALARGVGDIEAARAGHDDVADEQVEAPACRELLGERRMPGVAVLGDDDLEAGVAQGALAHRPDGSLVLAERAPACAGTSIDAPRVAGRRQQRPHDRAQPLVGSDLDDAAPGSDDALRERQAEPAPAPRGVANCASNA